MGSSGFDGGVMDELRRNAVILDMPDRRIIENMKPAKRNGIRYRLRTGIAGIRIEITVTASGMMTGQIAGPVGVFEGGCLRMTDGLEPICWADTGEEFRFQSSLRRGHVRSEVEPAKVLDAFFSIFGVHTTAGCDGGYDHWKEAVQIYARYAASLEGASVQIVHQPPLMVPDTMPDHEPGHTRPLTANSETTVHDVSDYDDPTDMPEHVASVKQLQHRLCPQAMELTMAFPNLLFRRPHQEIFEAEPDGTSPDAILAVLKEHLDRPGRALSA